MRPLLHQGSHDTFSHGVPPGTMWSGKFLCQGFTADCSVIRSSERDRYGNEVEITATSLSLPQRAMSACYEAKFAVVDCLLQHANLTLVLFRDIKQLGELCIQKVALDVPALQSLMVKFRSLSCLRLPWSWLTYLNDAALRFVVHRFTCFFIVGIMRLLFRMLSRAGF